MTTPAIEIHDVHKSFRDKRVLNGLNLTVERGQTFAFLGRNGAGKTTTIQMLMGLLSPDEGSLSVLGRNPQQEPLEVRRTVGYLAEDQTMFGWMTCEEIIRFVAAFYPTWDHSLARRFVEQFEVPLKTKIRHLSKGQNVRLGLLLALAHRPELVILEHPLEFADTGLLPPLVDAVQQVRRRQGSVIWFTRRRAVLEDHGIPADRRYRIAGRQLLELETSA